MNIKVAICIDVDRDAPFPEKGLSHGVCLPFHDMPIDRLRDPSFFTIKGTIIGLDHIIQILDDNHWPATFFIEAGIIKKLLDNFSSFYDHIKSYKHDIGLHGLNHEDLSGKNTFIRFTDVEEAKIIDNAKNIFKKELNQEPVGFRAPYLEISENILNLLAQKGFLYDSSLMITKQQIPSAFYLKVTNNKLIEVPILRYETGANPFILYLWTLFEFTRPVNQILDIIETLIDSTLQIQNKEDVLTLPILTINLHPWHLAYLVKEKRYVSEHEIKKNCDNFYQLISYLSKNENIKLTSISRILK